MPEGDTIHRIALRFNAALAGRRLDSVAAPNPRSPLYGQAGELAGATLEDAEARGKHLLLHFADGQVVHSHLGMNGRWFVRADGSQPFGRPWLTLQAGSGVASQSGGKLLRLTSARRVRNDPALRGLGPDPLGPGFDEAAASRRLVGWEPTEAVGAALLDQRLLAGVGNVIRIEACFAAAVSPWRPIAELTASEAEQLVASCRSIMRETVRTGRRPKQIYGAEMRPCPRCGGRVRRRGQGDANRTTSWCPGCQL
jgi:endonuclease VIII